MKKLSLIILSALLFIVITIASSFLCEKSTPMLQINNGDYPKAWKTIDSLENKGLLRSALTEVEKLYDRAKKDDNPAQVVKTLIYTGKYISQLEEDGAVKAIGKWQGQLENAGFPEKEILQSLLAELYQRYLQSNYWVLKDRTTVLDSKDEDILTWPVERFVSESRRLYRASIAADQLQQVNIEDFEAITYGGERTRGMRPTLYDFLVHRYLDYLMDERSYLTEPSYKFNIDSKEAFAPAKAFVQQKWESPDEQSPKLEALKVFQQLLAFHLDERVPTALVDADLKRLKFAYDNCILAEKADLYEQALEQLQEQYGDHHSSASVSFELAELYYNRGRNYQPNPENKGRWLLKRAHDLCTRTIELYEGTPGGQNCKYLINLIENKQINLQVEQVNLPKQPIIGRLSFQNIDTVFFKVSKIDEKTRAKLDNLRFQEFSKFFNDLPSKRSWSFGLPNPGDFQEHSVEVPIDGLPVGLYLVMASPDENFPIENGATAYLFTHVSSLGHWARNDQEGKVEIITFDRVSGTPEEGVTADLFKRDYNSSLRRNEWTKVGSGVSDKEGYIATKVKDEGYIRIELNKKGDELKLDEGVYSSSRRYRDQGRNLQTHFFLDRAIYRPGQTIYFKGIVLERDDKNRPTIVPNWRFDVTLYDVNGQKVESQQLTSNEYGTVNGSFIAPRSGILGQMHLQSSAGGNYHYFRVEEYKRPKFEVTFQPVQGSYRLDEDVSVEGQAAAYAGSVVDGASVNYRVVREVRFPFLPYWRRYIIWPFPQERMEIANGTTTTDSEGKFEVNFKAIPDRTVSDEARPIFHFRVYADVTDITGETRSGETQVNAGAVALNVDLKVPSRANRKDLKEIEVHTTNLNGQFEPADGVLTIELLQAPGRIFKKRYWQNPDTFLMEKEEFQKIFPALAFGGEDEPQNWPAEKVVLKENFYTDKSEKVTFNAGSWPVGTYKVSLETRDKFGTPIQMEQLMTLYNESGKNVPANEVNFLAEESKAYEPGEIARVFFGSAYKTVHACLEVEHDGRILSRKWMQVKNMETLEFPVKEAYRGNFVYHLRFGHDNRSYEHSRVINVPWTNKELQIEYATFRDKLKPGQEEEWRIKISGPKGDQVAAEMVAAMYDASLDLFAANSWSDIAWPSYGMQKRMQPMGFNAENARVLSRNWNPYSNRYRTDYRNINWFGFYIRGRGGPVMYRADDTMLTMDAVRAAPAAGVQVEEAGVEYTNGPVQKEIASLEEEQPAPEAEEAPPAPPVRRNLEETVFFFPKLMTDGEGNVVLRFTMNEALTRWNFLGFAHTKDLQTALTTNQVVTQKELMVLPNPPRFMREGDAIEYTAKVSNLTDQSLQGNARLELFDAVTNQPVDSLLGNTRQEVAFTAPPGQSAALKWQLKIPAGKVQALVHRVVAQAGDFSDGEESALPILTNRMLVTEALPLWVRGNDKRKFTFQSLKNSGGSSSLQHHKFTLEFTSNPAWYAVQALPYLMEYPYECAEQVFNRYYANALATSVANSHPRIRQVFDQWRKLPEDQTGSDAFLSNLAKNQELKSALLEETPWVVQAQDEEQQKKNIALLFDLNRMADEQSAALAKLRNMQLDNGGFAWFSGGRDSWYITQYIVEGMGHLHRLAGMEALNTSGSGDMLEKAVRYVDDRMVEHFRELEARAQKGDIDLKKDHLNGLAIHYLYARSFFLQQDMDKQERKVMDYYLGQAEKYWNDKGLYHQGMLSLALSRHNRAGAASDIVKSLKERAIRKDELGMYWKQDWGYFWYQLPIETQALMIEVFDEVSQDKEAVEELKIWLLKNKQTNSWKTTKGTAAAVYALLMRGDEWLLEDQPVEISLGKEVVDQARLTKQAGTGYFKTSWPGNEVSDDMASIKVENPNQSIAWGAAFWQYFEDLDKIDLFQETPLTITKGLFIEERSDRGPVLREVKEGGTLEVGQKLIVRLELRVDRPMEFVHMKDMRASGLEPLNVLSQYKWQGGLGYYESTRDVATNFFFSNLPRGTYVFEYPLRVVHRGDFSNGITTIQCMYAPEFTSHSEGVRVNVK